MTTYKGLPGPHICDFWTRESIGGELRRRLDLPDRPDRHGRQHRHLSRRAVPPLCRRQGPGGAAAGIAGRPAGHRRPAAVRERAGDRRRRTSTGSTSRGKAVLVHTGWDRHWRTDAYFGDHPLPDRRGRATGWSRNGAALVGIDSYNIDDTQSGRGRCTPAARRRHPDLRAYDRPRQLPDSGFRFSAVPPKVGAWAPSRCALRRARRLSGDSFGA